MEPHIEFTAAAPPAPFEPLGTLDFSDTEYQQWLSKQQAAQEPSLVEHYKPAGPVAAAFLRADNDVCVIMGPVGSGKTSAAFIKCLVESAKQPASADGVRYVKIVAYRPTYRVLYSTTISSWLQWFPLRTYPDFSGGSDRPAVHRLKYDLMIGGKLHPLDIEIHFQAVGDKTVDEVTRGFECSICLLDEVDLMHEKLFNTMIGARCGRWPATKNYPEGGSPIGKMICSFNAPVDDNWTVNRFIENASERITFFRQPAGNSPDAENLKGLPKGYYERAKEFYDPWSYRRFVLNMPAPERGGEIIYEQWNDDVHLSKAALLPLENYPIKIGLDQGFNSPAAIIAQEMPNGQWRVLEEHLPKRLAYEDFAQGLVRVLQERYRTNPISLIACDPAGFQGANIENFSCFAEVLEKSLGFRVTSAPSQVIQMRLSAVKMQLKQFISAGVPLFLVDPTRCPVLVKGFRSGYCWEKNKDGDNPKPSKRNGYSDVHDALQYLLYTTVGHAGVVEAAALGNRAGAFKRGGGCIIAPSNFKLFD